MKKGIIAICSVLLLLTASIAVLGTGCGGGADMYELDMEENPAAGGTATDVTGASPYEEGTEVSIQAVAASCYQFVNWSAPAGTFDDPNAATTNFTMPAQNVTVTANFALNITMLGNVPDTNQPPTITLPSTPPGTNYCAPMAMVNILGYWDVVMGHSNAENLTAFQPPPNPLNTVAEYLGYFMDTNGTGSPARANPGVAGTYDVDIKPGTLEFVRWDIANPGVPAPPFPLPAGKLGYDWVVTPDFGVVGFDFYTDEIDAGRPLVTCFNYWNPQPAGINFTDPETEEVIHVFMWGDEVPGSYYPNPEEYWSDDVGHAVTGVGYILDCDPDGSGELPEGDYVIVHDNWPTTPMNVAIPWANWKSSHAADPGPGP